MTLITTSAHDEEAPKGDRAPPERNWPMMYLDNRQSACTRGFRRLWGEKRLLSQQPCCHRLNVREQHPVITETDRNITANKTVFCEQRLVSRLSEIPQMMWRLSFVR